VGVLGVPVALLGTESQLAAVMGVELLDYRARLLASVPAGSQFVNVSLAELFEDLDRVANAATGEVCVLVSNFDLALGRLRTDERTILWRTLLTDFPNKTRALILCVPRHEGGIFVFPDVDLRRMWQESERYADWPDGRGDGQQPC
jgi:hypothetical protein